VAVRISVVTSDGSPVVRIAFTGRDRWATLSRGVVLPAADVAAAYVEDRRAAEAGASLVRAPGTSWPGVVRAGRYGVGSTRELWCVHRGSRVLVLRTTRPRLRRVVIEVDDPDASAELVNRVLIGS
jgi:hypothetical protein